MVAIDRQSRRAAMKSVRRPDPIRTGRRSTPGQLEAWFSGHPVASVNNPAMAALPAVLPEGSLVFDAGRSAHDQLISAGVCDGMCSSAACTASHPDVLCSAGVMVRPRTNGGGHPSSAPVIRRLRERLSRCGPGPWPRSRVDRRGVQRAANVLREGHAADPCASRRARACSGCSPAFFTL